MLRHPGLPKKILVSVLLFFFFAPSPLFAIVLPQVYLTDLDISNTQFEPGDLLSGSVSLKNYEEYIVSDLGLSYQLLVVDADGVPTQVIDETPPNQYFSLPAVGEETRNFSYQLPSNLPKGSLNFRVQLKSARGEDLGWADEKIEVGGKGNFLSLSNYWFIVDNEQVDPGGGYNFDRGDVPVVVFKVENSTEFLINAYPRAVTYKRNVSEDPVRSSNSGVISLSSGESLDVELELPSIITPDSYLTEVRMYDSDTDEPVSNAIFFRWIIVGDDAEVITASADKSSYNAGDGALITIQYSGPAAHTIDHGGEGVLEVELYDQAGNLVGKEEKNILLKAGEAVLNVPVSKNVENPQVVSRISQGSKILDEYVLKSSESVVDAGKTSVDKQDNNDNRVLLIGALAGVLFIAFSVVMFFLRSRAPKETLVLLFFTAVSLSLLAAPEEAFAVAAPPSATEVTGGCCDTGVFFNTPNPGTTYDPGDQINFSGYFKVTRCNDGLFFNKVTFYITEDSEIPITDCCGDSVDYCRGRGITCGCDEGCRDCYGASSTKYTKTQMRNTRYCDEVKYLDMSSSKKLYKLGTIYPTAVTGRARSYRVEYSKTYTIPEDIGFSGPVRFYVQYSGTHWKSHWHWNITYQKGYLNALPGAESDAGPDRTVEERNNIVLEGSALDEDGAIVGYSWYCEDGTLTNANSAQPTFTAPSVDADTNYICTLTATSDDGSTDSDDMQVTVTNVPCESDNLSPLKPDPPTVECYGSGIDSVKVSWPALSDVGCAGLHSVEPYHIQVWDNQGDYYLDRWQISTSAVVDNIPTVQSDERKLFIRLRAKDNFDNLSEWSDEITHQMYTCLPTAQISGTVWDDTNSSNCTLDAGETGLPELANLTVSISGRQPDYCGGSACETRTEADGYYILENVPYYPAGSTYSICVERPDPEASWSKLDLESADCVLDSSDINCDIINLSGDLSHDFAFKNTADSWIQVIDGDVHTNSTLSVNVPNYVHPDIEPYFIADSSNTNSGSGIATAAESIDPWAKISERGSNYGWSDANYRSRGPQQEFTWPSILDAVDQNYGTGRGSIEYVAGDLTITETDIINDTYEGRIVIAENIIIDKSVGDLVSTQDEVLNAILIARGKITLEGPLDSELSEAEYRNKLFKIKGSMYAKDGFDFARKIENTRIPVLQVSFDPSFYFNSLDEIKQEQVYSWSETAAEYVGRCSCSDWVTGNSVGSCGDEGCTSTQIPYQKTRSCTPAGCASESEIECITETECSCICGEWSNWSYNDFCGTNGCSNNSMSYKRTRSCTPPGCKEDLEYRCQSSWVCSFFWWTRRIFDSLR